jgi:hypothetical protein
MQKDACFTFDSEQDGAVRGQAGERSIDGTLVQFVLRAACELGNIRYGQN